MVKEQKIKKIMISKGYIVTLFGFLLLSPIQSQPAQAYPYYPYHIGPDNVYMNISFPIPGQGTVTLSNYGSYYYPSYYSLGFYQTFPMPTYTYPDLRLHNQLVQESYLRKAAYDQAKMQHQTIVPAPIPYEPTKDEIKIKNNTDPKEAPDFKAEDDEEIWTISSSD